MKTTESNTDLAISPNSEHQKGIENHKKAALHYVAASKSHLAAARHHRDGNHDKAAKSTIEAHGHVSLGNEAQNEDAKHHVLHN